MEDEEEIQSHGSGASGSLPPSSPNGRIAVTVAAAPPLAMPQSSAHNALTLALPIQTSNKNNGGEGGGGGGGGREDCWSEGATAVLIDAWGERYLELSRGNLKQKHWKEVADVVSGREDYTKTPKTDVQCKNRIDTVKKKYKSEKAKIAACGGQSQWLFFDRLDHLIGPTVKIPAASAGPSSISMSGKVRVAIPVGVCGIGNQFQIQEHQQPQRSKTLKNHKLRRRSQMDSEEESEEEHMSPDSDDSFAPEKKPRVMRKEVIERREKKGGWGNSLRLLTRKILKFGEAYEAAENAKLQQMLEIEKQRMKFAKDVEKQRMQFFMKTQLEISRMKHGRRGVSSCNHHCNNGNNSSDNN